MEIIRSIFSLLLFIGAPTQYGMDNQKLLKFKTVKRIIFKKFFQLEFCILQVIFLLSNIFLGAWF